MCVQKCISKVMSSSTPRQQAMIKSFSFTLFYAVFLTCIPGRVSDEVSGRVSDRAFEDF